MKKAHPWQGILSVEEEKERKKADREKRNKSTANLNEKNLAMNSSWDFDANFETSDPS